MISKRWKLSAIDGTVYYVYADDRYEASHLLWTFKPDCQCAQIDKAGHYNSSKNQIVGDPDESDNPNI